MFGYRGVLFGYWNVRLSKCQKSIFDNRAFGYLGTTLYGTICNGLAFYDPNLKLQKGQQPKFNNNHFNTSYTVKKWIKMKKPLGIWAIFL